MSFVIIYIPSRLTDRLRLDDEQQQQMSDESIQSAGWDNNDVWWRWLTGGWLTDLFIGFSGPKHDLTYYTDAMMTEYDLH